MRANLGLGLGLVLLLSACAAPPLAPAVQASAAPPVAPIAAAEAGTRYFIDAAASAVRIHAFRAGRAANLGHNHVLTVPKLIGLLLLPSPDTLAGARLELVFRLDEMVIDAPELRAALGSNWASLMSSEAIAATRTNMLGEGNLQAERFPEVRLHSRKIGGEWPKAVAEIEVELHGQRRSQWVAVELARQGDAVTASGRLVVRQSEFGITPFSVMGGLLAVRDELLVEFELVAQTKPSNGSTSTTSPAATLP